MSLSPKGAGNGLHPVVVVVRGKPQVTQDHSTSQAVEDPEGRLPHPVVGTSDHHEGVEGRDEQEREADDEPPTRPERLGHTDTPPAWTF